MDQDQRQLEGLLALAAKKMGATPEQLRRSAENGELNAALSGADPALRRALEDPEAARRLLASPQVQQLLAALKKGG